MLTLYKIMRNQQKYENLTYLALWSLLFIAPVLSLYIRSTTDTQLTFSWLEVLMVWRKLLFFLAAFLVHNFLLAPLLVYRGRRWTYFALVAVMVTAFAVWQCSSRPDERHFDPTPHEHFERPEPAEMGEDGPPPLPFDDLEHEPRHPKPHDDLHVPIIMGQHDVVSVIMLILMLGMNLGVKLYFKQRHDQQQVAELEKQNLERQLEYLRYQINPHFFMNTLNNIHALVDIDPEKAKHTILELSKMMRFVLYEGNKKMVPLSAELGFLQNYITLMSLRYTDNVQITVNLPSAPAGSEVPPLLFVTFVENAFKHGISYQQQSFVEVGATIENGMLTFQCRNSKKEEKGERKEERAGGVGLKNIRERLELIYGSRYTLNITNNTNTYHIELTIPL